MVRRRPSAEPELRRTSAADARPVSDGDDNDDPRASPDAIRKRRAARRLNDLLSGAPPRTALDGRTELKRKRLLAELERNTNNRGKALKPVEVLQHASDLLSLGETMATLRKIVRVAPPVVADRDGVVAMLREVHDAYGFHESVYELLGLSPEILVEADLRSSAPRRGRPKREPR